ncbi:MAG: ABC transporter ATP-binding protein [Dehalococcoidia bacterium]|uniref:ABC transporter ATP-binding protein n=1 Tax=Candidatus Amarobacter glycogenicus TaxID=3140699 RepID=UPI003134A4D4|nr:ABC transporter ATP-binding protein [Dehalococcoidia bacterium]MBK7125769.1 ABC transporter ATP-binding protein [Dehalococcoidia bacterium]MBK7328650.1 ABC transporter ATP-binding protein [Dehalococcoidia bacterium]MBK8559343.1 ABC transporter ATP-binding protein [Dehalococcoidia bacterium]MBK9342402.1 ABC transporter ATP-binding protein [Dehalococcoidia bacterium]
MRMGSFGMPTEKPKDFGAATRKLIQRLRVERGLVAVAIVMTIASVCMSVVLPEILGRATDVIVRGLFTGNEIDFDELGRIIGLASLLLLGSWALQYGMSYLLAGVVQRTMYRLRADVEDKLNRLPLSYIDRAPRGDLLSRVTNDIDNIAQSLQQSLSQLLTQALTLIGTVAIMVWISWQLSIVALVTIPLTMVMMRAIARRSRTRFIAQWRNTGKLNSQVEETFTGHAIVKAFGRQREVERVFRETNDELYEASFGAQFVSGIIQPATMMVGNLNFVAIAVLGGIRVANGGMTIGGVQAFIQYSRTFTQPLSWMASMVNLLQSGIASAERVFELLDAEEQSPEVSAYEPVGQTAGRVEFSHVSFSYNPERPLITDLSLTAEPGRTVAIVGPTGAGKTTLVNLIMRFYELDGGQITVDGRDITAMPRRELRSQIGMVLQDTWLFGGTIRENIAYGNLGASDEQILEAARATYVDRFVHSLPDGYETRLDDDGSSVSAGERQLITIARAFLADRPILILDEATSSVDTRTEVLVQHAMAALRSQRTSFVIAHRLSTIRDAETILVMDGGRIVEQGNHVELLAREGHYANLYNAQFAGEVEAIA